MFRQKVYHEIFQELHILKLMLNSAEDAMKEVHDADCVDVKFQNLWEWKDFSTVLEDKEHSVSRWALALCARR